MKRNILFFLVFSLTSQLPGQNIPVLAGVEKGALEVSGRSDPIAAGKPKFLGCAYGPAQAFQFTEYWNQVTPENAGKWGSVEGVQDLMNWNELDNAYALAKGNGYIFKLHTLIWGNQQPDWIENLPPAEQLVQIQEWFQALADRYPDIDVVEVVNEPLNDPPNSPGNGGGNYIAALGGTGATGFDWVIQAFTMARQYFPNAQLMINEFNILNSNSAANEYKMLIELLQDEGLIDQIGVQGHYFTTENATVFQLNQSLNILASTGLPVFVTELDIKGATDQIQLDEYKRVFPELWKHPAVRGITLWGFRPGLWVTDANLIASNGVTERPALIWLRNFVMNYVLKNTELSDSRSVRLFPNPASSGFFIQGLDQVERVAILNMQGQSVQAGTPVAGYFPLSQKIEPGCYVVLLYKVQRLYVKKIIIN